MELINFEGEILTADSGIIRRIKVKGEGYSTPNDGANVEGRLNIYFKNTYLYIIISKIELCHVSYSAFGGTLRGPVV